MLLSKDLRLITLTENTTSWLWLAGESGWSILIEAEGQRYLFDTGLTNTAVFNADRMGISLASIDKILLSHGHNDHTGGLRNVLQNAGMEVGQTNYIDPKKDHMEIICHPEVWGPKYIRHKDHKMYHFGGIPFQREDLEKHCGARFTESHDPVYLTEDIVWSGEIPMTNDFEHYTSICFLKKSPDAALDDDSQFEPDPCIDDASMYIRTEKGLVIVTGCCHRGIINTIHHAQKTMNEERIHMVVGGTHLCDATEERVEKTVAELKRLKVGHVGSSHCTGFHAMRLLSNALGPEVFFPNNAGHVINFKDDQKKHLPKVVIH
jgi:7,8-dihydropterin-6-yl-methyl-4-(beta-D-ribofuranosyl)aminobenzene 5'-phosphate synthase